jgi:transposase
VNSCAIAGVRSARRRRELKKERKITAEYPVGTIKRALEAGCCLCKGKADGEFALTFPACNMKRAINMLGTRNLLKAFA